MYKRRFFPALVMVIALLGQLLPAPLPVAAAACDWAQFVADVTIPDDTILQPGATFTKTWRMKNIGTCTWTTAYSLVFDSGEQLGAPATLALTQTVAPTQTVDLSVSMTAPSASGTYRSNWKLKNASGASFGIGSSGDQAFWTQIKVGSDTGIAYDFVANAASAKWQSGAGLLSFPGTEGDSKGFGLKLDSVQMETGVTDTRASLLAAPQNKTDGYIQALYPAFAVQSGDHFKATIGCQYGATACYVTYRIDYRTSAGTKTLWTFKERYDGMVYNVDLDLSALAGKSAEFFLLILATGSPSGDRPVWIAPRITRAGATPPTPTNTPPGPTLTPTPGACTDHAVFIADGTVPDGTVFAPNTAFTKTWRIKNIGTCTWTTAYKLVYVSGAQMGGPASANFTSTIGPNTTADFSVNLTAPASSGAYSGYWQFQNAAGAPFGIGSNWDTPFWVSIVVSGGSISTPTRTPTATLPPPISPTRTPGGSGVVYDFVANAALAKWQSGAGALTFPGTDGDSKGFGLKLDSIQMETGSTDTRASLLAAPQNKTDGYIQALYPAFTVQSGDRFQATIGCQYGATACYVTYRLDARTNTGTKTLWTFKERYDGMTYDVNLDLSSLAGKSTEFFLLILATGSPSGDRPAWIAPRIVRGNAPSPTPTPVTLPIVSAPYIRSLRMLDTTNGWAFGDGYVLRTNNGGQTWYNVTPPGAALTGLQVGGYFANLSQGWVVTGSMGSSLGTLYRTTDGGLSWVHYDVPFGGGTLQFLDNFNGFALTILGAAMNKQAVALYQTADGGATWTRKYINDPTVPGYGNSLPLGGHKNGLYFRDTARGWIGGDTPADGFVYFYTTADGGITWAQQPLALPAGYANAYVTLSAPVFFGATEARLPVWLGTNAGRDLFIYSSHDGGASWTASSGFTHGAEGADFVSTTTAFSWDWANLFHVTTNTGATWQTVTPNVNFSDSFRGLDFVSPTTGWVILGYSDNSTALYRTIDGGATWTLLSSNAAPTPTPTAELPVTDIANVESVEVQIVEGQPLQANAIVRGLLRDNGCTTIHSVDQTLYGNNFQLVLTTLTDSLAQCAPTPVPYQQTISLGVASLPPAQYIVNANGATTSFELLTRDFTTFNNLLVQSLNTRNFDLLKLMMDQSFGFAYWMSQGSSYAPDDAIAQLQLNHLSATPALIPDPNKDLVALLGGADPYQIMGLDPAKSQALFVSGWGLDGKSEAILYAVRLPDGSLYWHSVLVSPAGMGFGATPKQ